MAWNLINGLCIGCVKMNAEKIRHRLRLTFVTLTSVTLRTLRCHIRRINKQQMIFKVCLTFNEKKSVVILLSSKRTLSYQLITHPAGNNCICTSQRLISLSSHLHVVCKHVPDATNLV